mmetsp:Transcript_18307/g.30575  ORF Transcript_18307/g.30575 Transcript_18307/m.30575 type:complete len:203 (-) Transcript_18307:104-712(-)
MTVSTPLHGSTAPTLLHLLLTLSRSPACSPLRHPSPLRPPLAPPSNARQLSILKPTHERSVYLAHRRPLFSPPAPAPLRCASLPDGPSSKRPATQMPWQPNSRPRGATRRRVYLSSRSHLVVGRRTLLPNPRQLRSPSMSTRLWTEILSVRTLCPSQRRVCNYLRPSKMALFYASSSTTAPQTPLTCAASIWDSRSLFPCTK